MFELFSYNQSWADTDTKNFEIVDTDNGTDKNFNYGCYRAKVSRGKWAIAKVDGPESERSVESGRSCVKVSTELMSFDGKWTIFRK